MNKRTKAYPEFDPAVHLHSGGFNYILKLLDLAFTARLMMRPKSGTEDEG